MRREDAQDQAQEGLCNFLRPSHAICPIYVAQNKGEEGQEDAQEGQDEAQEGQEEARDGKEESSDGQDQALDGQEGPPRRPG